MLQCQHVKEGSSYLLTKGNQTVLFDPRHPCKAGQGLNVCGRCLSALVQGGQRHVNTGEHVDDELGPARRGADIVNSTR